MSRLVTFPEPRVAVPLGASSRSRGFSLLEVAIAILLLGLLLSIVGPTMGALSGAELRRVTSQIQGLVRDTYSRVAVTGQPHRVVFDLEAGSYLVEKADGPVALKRAAFEPDRDKKGLLVFEDERLTGTEDSDDVEDQEKRRLWGGPMWTPVDDELGVPQKLPTDVRIHAFWADHLTDTIFGGYGALHFFPGGTLQEAHITISDDEAGENTLTVVTEPLTGETFVETEIPRVPG